MSSIGRERAWGYLLFLDRRGDMCIAFDGESILGREGGGAKHWHLGSVNGRGATLHESLAL